MKQQVPGEERVMTALLTARPEKRDELIQTILLLSEKARAQAGCLDCMVGQDLGGQPRFLFYLLWKDQFALETYMGSEGFRILLGASSTLAVPAEFHFDAVNGLKAARGMAHTGDPRAASPSRSPFP